MNPEDDQESAKQIKRKLNCRQRTWVCKDQREQTTLRDLKMVRLVCEGWIKP